MLVSTAFLVKVRRIDCSISVTFWGYGPARSGRRLVTSETVGSNPTIPAAKAQAHVSVPYEKGQAADTAHARWDLNFQKLGAPTKTQGCLSVSRCAFAPSGV